MSEDDLNLKIAKTLLELEIAEQQIKDIQFRMQVLEEENTSMRSLLEEVNERTKQFKRSSLDIMIEAPWSPNEINS